MTMPTFDELRAAQRQVSRARTRLRQAASGPVGKLGGAGLTGGLVAAQVDELVHRRHADAQTFAGGLTEYASELSRRAGVAVRLDVDWRDYDRAYDTYLDDVRAWEAARDVYLLDPMTNPYPGNVPTAPTEPAAGPAWYERTVL